jgi:Flp pilus assembly protein CpaB
MAKRKPGSKKSSGLGAFGFTLLALICTASTAFFLAQMMKGSKYNVTPMRTVLVAQREIPASEVIEPAFFKEIKVPINSIPKKAYRTLKNLFPKGNGQDPVRVLINKVYANEFILPQRVSNPKRGTGFASMVDSGYRAFSLTVDRRVTRANLVYPSALVDILTTMRRSDSRESITKLVVQRVRVLAVNGITDADELYKYIRSKNNRSSNDVVTLHVNPDQAEALTLASREGVVDVLLRNTNDSKIVDTQGVSASELTQADENEAVKETKTESKSARSKRYKYRRRRVSNQERNRSRKTRNRKSRGRKGTQTLSID